MKTSTYLALAVVFFVVALALIFLQGCMSYPVATTQKPESCTCNFGPCQMPPTEKEGFLLIACKVESSTSISCLYFGIVDDRKCAIVVHTDDCVNYSVSDAQCEMLPQSTPKGETIKWL